jgi:LacI family transcriptional regulator
MGHLAARGHRVIARITAPGASLGAGQLRAAARAHGLQAPACLAVAAGGLTADAGHRHAKRLLATGAGFTAIAAGSDILAAGCCRAIAEAGRACPASVSVTGFGDLPLAGSLTPALTTVRLPQYAVGAAAARLLLGQLGEDAAATGAVLLPPELIARDSVACAPD